MDSVGCGYPQIQPPSTVSRFERTTSENHPRIPFAIGRGMRLQGRYREQCELPWRIAHEIRLWDACIVSQSSHTDIAKPIAPLINTAGKVNNCRVYPR